MLCNSVNRKKKCVLYMVQCRVGRKNAHAVGDDFGLKKNKRNNQLSGVEKKQQE